MWKKAVIGVAAAALIGTAGVAAATAEGSPVSQPTPTATAPSTPTHGAGTATGHRAGRPFAARLRNVQHAEWVSRDRSGGFVTHEAIVGDVTAVSATSVTVRAADGKTLTYAVGPDTKVRLRSPGTVTTAKITDLTIGQKVRVTGTKQPDLTARLVAAKAS